MTIGDFKQHQWNPYHGPRLLKLGHLGEQGYLLRILAPSPLKIGDFGVQDDQARIWSLYKTSLYLNTCPGLKMGHFGD